MECGGIGAGSQLGRVRRKPPPSRGCLEVAQASEWNRSFCMPPRLMDVYNDLPTKPPSIGKAFVNEAIASGIVLREDYHYASRYRSLDARIEHHDCRCHDRRPIP